MNRIVCAVIVLSALLAGCNGQSKQEMLDQGIAEYQAGQIDQAKETFTAFNRQYPGDPEANYHLGRISQSEGRNRDAVFHYQLTLRTDPAHKPAQVGLQQAQREQRMSRPGL